MITETSTNLGRVQLIEGTPPALPGKCALCGTTNSTFVDMGWDIEFYGVVYFCRHCIIQVCNVIGYFSGEQFEKMRIDYEALKEQVEHLMKENEEYKRAVYTLNNVLGRTSIGIVGYLPHDEKSIEVESDSSEREDGFMESIDESGSEDVFSNVSIDDFDPKSI